MFRSPARGTKIFSLVECARTSSSAHPPVLSFTVIGDKTWAGIAQSV